MLRNLTILFLCPSRQRFQSNMIIIVIVPILNYLVFHEIGSHWMWEIVNVLLTGSISKKPKEASLPDLTPVEDIDSLPSPRILNSHYPPRLFPDGIKEKKTKIVHLYRNPKDVAVSAYFHLSKFSKLLCKVDFYDMATFIENFHDWKCKYHIKTFFRRSVCS